MPPRLAAIAGVLAMRISPDPEFVSGLRQQLIDSPLPLEQAASRPSARIRSLMPARLRLAASGLAVAVLAIGGALAFTLLRDTGSAPPPLSADVIKQSALNLFDLDTVRYTARVDVRRFADCYSAFGALLNEEEKAELAARGDEVVETGIVYGCGSPDGTDESVYSVEENGVYDLANSEFSSASDQSGSPYPAGVTLFDPTRADEYFPAQRVLARETLYTRSGDGEWQVTPNNTPWAPFQFPSFQWAPVTIRAVPVSDLEYLGRSYDSVEFVGEEKLDGVQVFHYRVENVTPGLTHTTEAWVGRDGLPRRAVVVLAYSKNISAESHLGFLLDTLATDPEYGEYRDAPIFQRGEWPDRGPEYTYTYEFSGFNEPVSIVAPIP